MRRRTLLVVLAGLAVVVAAGVVVLSPQRPSRITPDNFDRIRDGMGHVEVEAILGPPGDYRTGPNWGDSEAAYVAPPPTAGIEWLADDGCRRVVFDRSGRVEFSYFEPSRRMEQTRLERRGGSSRG
jgi:hypothetical protein